MKLKVFPWRDWTEWCEVYSKLFSSLSHKELTSESIDLFKIDKASLKSTLN